jgi:hypothetical protein
MVVLLLKLLLVVVLAVLMVLINRVLRVLRVLGVLWVLLWVLLSPHSSSGCAHPLRNHPSTRMNKPSNRQLNRSWNWIHAPCKAYWWCRSRESYHRMDAQWAYAWACPKAQP